MIGLDQFQYQWLEIFGFLEELSLEAIVAFLKSISIWDASWQNQQNDCAPNEDSDQPGHPPSLIRVFAVRSIGSEGPKLSSCGCPGWSESSLGAHAILLVLSCRGFIRKVHENVLKPKNNLTKIIIYSNVGLFLMLIFKERGYFNTKVNNPT